MKGVVVLVLATGAGLTACGGSSTTAPTPPPTQWPSVNICSVLAGQVTSGAAIINGSTCTVTDSPIVQLSMSAADGSGYRCSGSVIGRRTVLTAAHCVAEFTSVSVTWFNNTTVLKGTPPFQTLNGVDVAIVSTDADFQQKALPLINRAVNAGDPGIVAGYGATESVQAASVLRAGWTTITVPDSALLQAQYTPGTTSGVCYGDSGGPLLAQDSGGSWALAGVTSTLSGNGCATSATTNQFVNVRNPAVAAFISNALANAAGK